MSEICYNNECVYWTRESDGKCDAACFCGGFTDENGKRGKLGSEAEEEWQC